VRMLPALAIGGVAVSLAGSAFALAAPKTHVMNVNLPDGSIARVEYVGDVAPKVTVAPPRYAGAVGPRAMSFPSFAGFDRMMAEMQRRSDEMMRQAQEMSRQPTTGAAAPYIASYGNLPAGQSSTTVVSVSNNGVTCTRTTEVVSQGPGKAPKVTSSASGQCDGKTPSGPTHPA
jgi:hypothetical protein